MVRSRVGRDFLDTSKVTLFFWKWCTKSDTRVGGREVVVDVPFVVEEDRESRHNVHTVWSSVPGTPIFRLEEKTGGREWES